ncbi:MAG: SMC-Scp complex subunit ScpB [Candidatus Zixiibacteriota bacterium]|nr:MAG: SMC-Scp complex subunit ScpB [candidate division Zixibacteria bacterium]
MNTNGNHLPIIEALILSSPEPLPARKITDAIGQITAPEIELAVTELNEKYRASDSSFRIRKIAGGFQCYITESYAPFVEELHARRRNTRLSRAALEALAIIAYRQPVTKTDVEMIRGVASDSVIHTLLERKLVTLAGRASTIGRPLLYKTTDEFLKYFNLNSHDDLPRMEEIEELITSREPDIQPGLPLGMLTDSTAGDETGNGDPVLIPKIRFIGDDTDVTSAENPPHSSDPELADDGAGVAPGEKEPGEGGKNTQLERHGEAESVTVFSEGDEEHKVAESADEDME